ncbi:zinc finger protein ZIC 5 [Staphylotrichum tortipilum]|uniref:Zinc finger protein ZIC 5 n=1 Tax=Staphylotrichum tortipilum TaxID=2831512 RepID=A0AAN6MSA0_9PEZI|nr:zinc finger protein ZIC 5 [Staphylotrichum longicolle]
MADPFVYGGSAFHYKDVPFPSPPYGDVDDTVLVDPSMTIFNIDPRLQSPSPSPYSHNCWPPPVPASSLKGASESTAFFGAPSIHSHASLRPTVGVTPVHRPPYARYTSPLSSAEPSSASSGGAFSPPAETEPFIDSYPRSPNDSALRSPFPMPLPLEPYHAVQFASMGPDYVNPHDLNPAQPAEFCDTDSSNIDFSFRQEMSFSFDGQPAQGALVPGLTVDPAHAGLTLEQPSQYPLPSREEEAGSDDEVLFKREADDDADEDYRLSKRSRTNTRAPARRSAAAPAASRRRRGRAANNTTTTTVPNTTGPAQRALPSSTAASSRHHLTCPSCSQRGFQAQPDLDAHIKKHHRPFNCVFDFAGCEATFATKNEWKRHASTQHLLLHYWRCTEGACANTLPADGSSSSSTSSNSDDPTGPNGAIFNRKDLFTQHLQRMHAPQQVKDHLAASKKSKTSPFSANPTSPATNAILTSWTARLRSLQSTCMHARCHLPARMLCPVPGCAEPPFQGHDAWNQRMEHVAKHMEQPLKGAKQTPGGVQKKVVFGGKGDPTLVEWAGSPDVAIIVRNPAYVGTPGGEGEWVLKSPLKRGPGGGVVITAPVQGRQQGRKRGWEGPRVEGEIVVFSGGGEEEEEDAEGEED